MLFSGCEFLPNNLLEIIETIRDLKDQQFLINWCIQSIFPKIVLRLGQCATFMDGEIQCRASPTVIDFRTLVKFWQTSFKNRRYTFIINGYQSLDIPILSNRDCDSAYNYTDSQAKLNPEGTLCAGYLEGGKSSCRGDDGGPLICNGELHGIVSWGFGCAKRDSPTLYTRVCDYVDWIEKIISWNWILHLKNR